MKNNRRRLVTVHPQFNEIYNNFDVVFVVLFSCSKSIENIHISVKKLTTNFHSLECIL